VYFAASVDDAETNKKFAEHVEADYPILSDPEKNAAKAYGVVDAQRQFASRWTFYIGPDGRIRAVDPKVSPRTAGEDVVRTLEELKVPKKKSSGYSQPFSLMAAFHASPATSTSSWDRKTSERCRSPLISRRTSQPS
jgi:AhpC/TSA family